jgi:hypothetical protein
VPPSLPSTVPLNHPLATLTNPLSTTDPPLVRPVHSPIAVPSNPILAAPRNPPLVAPANSPSTLTPNPPSVVPPNSPITLQREQTSEQQNSLSTVAPPISTQPSKPNDTGLPPPRRIIRIHTSEDEPVPAKNP